MLERERNWRLGRQESRGIRSFTCKEVWETASVYKEMGIAACVTVRLDVKEGRWEGFSGLLFSNRIWRDEKHDRISMTVLKLWI